MPQKSPLQSGNVPSKFPVVIFAQIDSTCLNFIRLFLIFEKSFAQYAGAFFRAWSIKKLQVEAARHAVGPISVCIETPLRAEILTREGIREYAAQLAEQHRVQVRSHGPQLLYRRFKQNIIILESTYTRLSLALLNKEPLSSGAEWLLDNYYIIQEQIRDIRRDFPAGYSRSLPKLSEGEFKAYPRVYHLTLEIIRHTDATIDSEVLSGFVQAYQSRVELSSGELWAVPIMLRFALLENLRRLAVELVEGGALKKRALQMVEEIVSPTLTSGTELLLVLASKLKENPELLKAGSVPLMRRLRELGAKAQITLHWLEERIREQGQDPNELARIEDHSQAATQISIGNTFSTLRLIAGIDWQEWVESVSLVHTVLSADPAQKYLQSDFDTREAYRHCVETLARRVRTEESQVAQKVITLCLEKTPLQAAASTSAELEENQNTHVGYYLIGRGLHELKTSVDYRFSMRERLYHILELNPFAIYFSTILVASAGMIAQLYLLIVRLGGTRLDAACGALTFSIPLIELAINVVQWIATRCVIPQRLPKLNFEFKVPDHCRTLVAVQGIYSDKEALTLAIEKLEVRYLGNDDANIYFALLADLSDADQEALNQDIELIEHAKKLIAGLNQRHADPADERFFLLFRGRRWSPAENKFMGWERKRGKIHQLNRLILGDDNTGICVHVGDLMRLRSVHYVLTLDSDSRLPKGVASKLIGTIAHPLNQAIFEEGSNVVRQGYGIIQPRVGTTLHSAQATRFSALFSGHSGLDPYTQTVSDVYQDIFHEGSFLGKGIYDVAVFERALQNRVPENAMLSHDLFEGCFARVGLATDIELFDDFPSQYQAYAQRQHRWVRGDWQLLPWILQTVPNRDNSYYQSPLGALGRWKLIDNLRRSLVSSMCFLFLCLSFIQLPDRAYIWISLVVFAIAFPVYANLVGSLAIPFGRRSFKGYFQYLRRSLLKSCAQAFFTLSVIPHQTCIMLHAIGVTLYRVIISKKNLLQWDVAGDVDQRWKNRPASVLANLGSGIALTLFITVSIVWFTPERVLIASPLLVLWACSPLLVSWLNARPTQTHTQLHDQDRQYLYELASQTWSYFDQFLNAENNFLVPDNIQLVPDKKVADRTSPTNISVSILSVLSAYDLGFLTQIELIERLQKVFQTLEKLERSHGHFLNWYQTKTLQALEPRYVSAVDSGNMVGHLIAARIAFERIPSDLLLPQWQGKYIQGLIAKVVKNRERLSASHLSLLESINRAVDTFPKTIPKIWQLIEVLESSLPELQLSITVRDFNDQDSHRAYEKLGLVLKRVQQLKPLICWFPVFEAFAHQRDLELKIDASTSDSASLAQLRIDIQDAPCTLNLLRQTISKIEKLPQDLSAGRLSVSADQKELQLRSDEQLKQAALQVTDLLAKAEYLDRQAASIVAEVNLGFLYDPRKKLFSIGYHVETGRKDLSYYDLLASESRLGSFVAIATGQVPQKHWFALGRSLVDSTGGTALISWTATMFEYLMPLLVMRDYEGTLLSESYRSVVRSQQRYADSNHVPWGISESAYCAVDFEKTYQYKAFGVPTLGLKRGLAEDLVVSPYSTFLALAIDPRLAVRNLRRLEREGMRGDSGFYEAIDYTPERLSAEETSHIVRTFFAHHQGMSLVSINNLLNHQIMQNRFHADLRVRASDLLIQEGFPELLPPRMPIREFSSLEVNGETEENQRVSKGEQFNSAHTSYPRTRVLSNGRYTLMVDNAGNGFSLLDREISLTRWREDGVAGQWGTYIYVRDLEDGNLWSVAYQPTRVEPDSYEVHFNPDKIEFKRKDFGIYLHTEITVSPEDNVEIRQVTATNVSGRKRIIELTSFGEVALALGRSDSAHPAFSKMFIETEYRANTESLLFSRRPRSKSDEHLYLMHSLAMRTVWAKTQVETSRFKFIGRGRSASSPAAFGNFEELSGTCGSVLDPVFALRTRIELAEGESATAVFCTGAAKSLEEIEVLAQRYRDLHSSTRAFEMAWSQSNIELRHEQFSIRQSQAFQKLITAILFNLPEFRGASDSIIRNRLSQSGLWRFSVSGDLPIVLISLTDPSHVRFVREMLLAHQYIRMRGISFDLIILNEYPGGYFQNFQEELQFMVRSGYSSTLVDKKGGVYLRTASQLSPEEQNLLRAIARVVLHAANGSLASQLKFEQGTASQIISHPKSIQKVGPAPNTLVSMRSSKNSILHNIVGIQSERRSSRLQKSKVRNENSCAFELQTNKLEFFNGFGGFVEEGAAYEIKIEPQTRLMAALLPPLPWSNIIANPDFGFLVTEAGAGYTWSQNSRENRLTPWSNDPVSDPAGEVIYIRDSEQGKYWCPTPSPVMPHSAYIVRHDYGFSSFQNTTQEITSGLTISGAIKNKVKWWNLTLKNQSAVDRRLEVFLYLDLVLGVSRDDSARHIVSNFDSSGNFLTATNYYNNEFAGSVVHLGSNLKIQGYTASRQEFLGRHRDLSCPAVFNQDEQDENILSAKRFFSARSEIVLSGKAGAGFDPCGAIKVSLILAPGQEREVLFYLSESSDIDSARKESQQYRLFETRKIELERVREFWKSIVSTIQVRTPDRAFDIMANGWLLYQNLSCRINARTAYYQSGGAIGFRDQLQDVLALLYASPKIARAQILLHSSRQFSEGDVQHWWHPPLGRGVRTRISDDFVWLPYVLCRYVEVSADWGILEEKVSYIDGPMLEKDQMEAYLLPQDSNRLASVYQHATLALDRALQQLGIHQLPLMGGGDWNDGMNEVGAEGRGESVWLAWFLCDCLRKFAVLARGKVDIERADRYLQKAQEISAMIDQHAWDGKWYRRAFFDNGAALGSVDNDECKIDSIAQSWSVIAGGADPERRKIAMESARSELVNYRERLIRLLAPPFDRGVQEPGYIKGYVPGIRENGGQYTHAACWLIMATALEGKGQAAFDLFSLVNPINHSLSSSAVNVYQAEPYVLCGDVYAAPEHCGRAGWSWYTGAAGWLYQVAVGNILGLKIFGDYFIVDPCVPPSWKNFSLSYQVKNVVYAVEVTNPQGIEQGVKEVKVDNILVADQRVYIATASDTAQKKVIVSVVMG